MKKVIPEQIIEGCCQCDSLDTFTNIEDQIVYRCIEEDEIVNDIDSIPPWCPLKDCQEAQYEKTGSNS